jgi:rhodanese-related sulfurtransferase
MTPSSPPPNPIRVVDAATIRAWWEAGAVMLVDVRETHEYQAGAIPGAISVPLSGFDGTQVPTPPPGQRLVIHCQSGVRCAIASARLVSAGWAGEVIRMQGGITAWMAAGGPTRRPG